MSRLLAASPLQTARLPQAAAALATAAPSLHNLEMAPDHYGAMHNTSCSTGRSNSVKRMKRLQKKGPLRQRLQLGRLGHLSSLKKPSLQA